MAAGSLLVLVLVYLPAAGELSSLLDRMRDAQRLHAALGHPFVFDDTLYTHSPPWANLSWGQWKSLGTPATVSVALCLLIAPFVLRRALAVLLIGATLLPFVFFAFVLGYALPHYYYDWQPAMIVTCALALYELSRRAIPYRVVAALALCPLVFAAAGTVRDVASLAPRDYTALERELGDRLGGEVVITNTFDFDLNLPGPSQSLSIPPRFPVWPRWSTTRPSRAGGRILASRTSCVATGPSSTCTESISCASTCHARPRRRDRKGIASGSGRGDGCPGRSAGAAGRLSAGLGGFARGRSWRLTSRAHRHRGRGRSMGSRSRDECPDLDDSGRQDRPSGVVRKAQRGPRSRRAVGVNPGPDGSRSRKSPTFFTGCQPAVF